MDVTEQRSPVAERPAAAVLRLAVAGLVASGATLALFLLMSVLVATGREALSEAPSGRIVDFVRVPDPPRLRVERPKPEKPPRPEPPPELPVPRVEVAAPVAGAVSLGPLTVDTELAVDASASLSAADGEYLPIVKVAPEYPARARERGIEGWVLLRFTVSETGAVVDPVVVASEPEGWFEEAALRAVQRFKYRPRIVNGKPQPVPGVEHLITFRLDRGTR